jgi:hypothetical protein
MHEFRIIPDSSCILSYLLFCRSDCTQLIRSTVLDEPQKNGTAVVSCSCCGTTIRLKVQLKIMYLIGINLQSGAIFEDQWPLSGGMRQKTSIPTNK